MTFTLNHKCPAAIFVFGSNLAGAHGAGAAREAAKVWGAQYGVGEGLTGQAYALPTKGEHLQILPLSQIAESIRSFILCARQRPDNVFLVTSVGCGLAGYSERDIAPLFHGSPENCVLPDGWRQFKKGTQ